MLLHTWIGATFGDCTVRIFRKPTFQRIPITSQTPNRFMGSFVRVSTEVMVTNGVIVSHGPPHKARLAVCCHTGCSRVLPSTKILLLTTNTCKSRVSLVPLLVLLTTCRVLAGPSVLLVPVQCGVTGEGGCGPTLPTAALLSLTIGTPPSHLFTPLPIGGLGHGTPWNTQISKLMWCLKIVFPRSL